MQLRVLVLDHFDSFTYNLVQLLRVLGAVVEVVRTNVPFDEVRRRQPTHVVFSPGPGRPENVPSFRMALAEWSGRVPILGVCLGHQAIGQALQGRVVRNYRLMHGKTSLVSHVGTGLFAGLPNPLEVMRYHSLVVSWPAVQGWGESSEYVEEFVVTAWTEIKGNEFSEVMAIASQRHDHVYGVQFHPESYYTQGGQQLLVNFLAIQ